MSQKNKLKKSHRREVRQMREKQKTMVQDKKIEQVEEVKKVEKKGGLIEVKVPNLFDIMNEVLVTPIKQKKLTEVVNPLMNKKYGEVYKVDLPQEGGVFVYMTGYDYPYRGLPVFNLLDKVKTAKRALKEEAFEMFESLKTIGFFGKLRLLISYKELQKLVVGMVRPLHKIIKECEFKEERYSQSIRELRNKMRSESPNEIIGLLKDVGLGVGELDNAYRFRIQDASEEVDKKKLVYLPENNVVFRILNIFHYLLKGFLNEKWMSESVKEIYRVMTLGIEKEKKPNMKPKMKTIRDLICLYLILSKKTIEWLKGCLKEVDFDALRLSKEDICFCNCRKDYKFRYKKELGNEEGVVVEQKCRLFDNKMAEKMNEINQFKKEKNEAKLKELGVNEIMSQIEVIQTGEVKLAAERDKEINKYERTLGELYRQRIKLLNQYLSKIEDLVKGQEENNKQ